jgi:hypothetical protein
MNHKGLAMPPTISVWTKGMILRECGRRSARMACNLISVLGEKRWRRSFIQPDVG